MARQINTTSNRCSQYMYFYKRAQRNGLVKPQSVLLANFTLCPSFGWLVPQGSNLDFSNNNIVYIGATNYNPGPCGSGYGCFVTPMAFCQLWSIRTQGKNGTERHLINMLNSLMYNVPNTYCGTSPRGPLEPMARKGRGRGRALRFKGLNG